MGTNKLQTRIMYLTFFSLGVVISKLMIVKDWFNEFNYLVLISLMIILLSLIYHYVAGVDYMHKTYPDYTGDDLFGEDGETNKTI